MGSSSLIHLFRWWLLEFTALLCGWSCLSLNFLSDSTGSAPLPLVHRRLDIALLKRPKAVLSRQHHEFGTLLLSFCDWWGLCSLPQLFFLSIVNRFKLQILCVTVVADLAPSWGFKPICIPGVVRIKFLFFYLESPWYYWIEENCYFH